MTAYLRSARFRRQHRRDCLSRTSGVILCGPSREGDETRWNEDVGIEELTNWLDTLFVDARRPNIQFDNDARDHTCPNGHDDTGPDNGCMPGWHAVGQEIECRNRNGDLNQQS